MDTETQRSAIPGIVTLVIPQEELATIQQGEAFPIKMAVQPGLCYDLSTLQILCGARRNGATGLVLDDDISMGLQMAINTIPAASPDDARPLKLMVYKE